MHTYRHAAQKSQGCGGGLHQTSGRVEASMQRLVNEHAVAATATDASVDANDDDSDVDVGERRGH